MMNRVGVTTTRTFLRLRSVNVQQLSKFTSGSITLRKDEGGQGLVHIQLNRPRANALSRAMVKDITAALQKIQGDKQCRAVIISSALESGVFCAGADLKERAAMPIEEVAPFVSSLRNLMSAIEALPMPTIAAVEGVALGGGLELMLACDMRIVGSNALLGLPETSLAIIPGAGGTQRLPRLIGVAAAKELIFTAEKIGGQRAEELGLVNHCVDPGEALRKATETGKMIAANGPLALRLAKQAISEGMNKCTLEEGMVLESRCYAQVITTNDRNEGLKAFAEKRKPKYTGT